MTATAMPAAAIEMAPVGAAHAAPTEISWNHGRDRGRHEGWYRGRGNRDRYYSHSRYRGDRVTRNTRVWRDRDGRWRCKKDNGTTGLLIGAAVGGLAGNEIAGRGDKTLGAILGAVGGGLLGREIDRSDARCR
ncbi:glycine zipper 2TM domain-containing protein [Altericroceibacterium spongiae]|uniref:17 kDa surface antigen n=2 Tax=Altericroceibacterium spongiae TaxID=2320269 RepID=A0A420EKX4_9SPHN|nr:glycine zipper 2TM domain-containing protein [Altericroceibacterium spongiae]